MSETTQGVVGSVVSIRRYPVKSMMGEELNAVDVTDRGLLGDRAYALLDPSTGKVASAKNPRKWAKLFDCRATFVEPPLRTAAQQNQVNVGIYTSVLRGGTVRRGDPVRLE